MSVVLLSEFKEARLVPRVSLWSEAPTPKQTTPNEVSTRLVYLDGQTFLKLIQEIIFGLHYELKIHGYWFIRLHLPNNLRRTIKFINPMQTCILFSTGKNMSHWKRFTRIECFLVFLLCGGFNWFVRVVRTIPWLKHRPI